MESRKKVLMKLFAGKQWRHRHREQTYEYGKQGEGEGEMYGESNMETYITIYKIYSKCKFAVWLKELKQGIFDNLEAWNGVGDGKKVQEGGDTCKPMADSC